MVSGEAVAAWLVAGTAAAALACGGGEGPAAAPPRSTQAAVTFEYVAATSIDREVAERSPACVEGAGQTHIHPSWRGFERVDMTAATRSFG